LDIRRAPTEPPKQYSIVEVANESRACRPAFSDNCITLAKGERVVVIAWQIDDKPRRGLYCLRPMNMIECYYADLTAIEINGVRVPTIGMDKSASAQRVEGPPPTVPPSQETPPQSSSPQQGSQDAKERLDERTTILARLRSTRKIIATNIGVLTGPDRARVEESAARFAAANDQTALVDLKALRAEADDVVRIFGEAEEFASVSEIAAKRIAVIEGELKETMSDAPVVLRVQAAIDAVKAARARSDLRVLQSSLGELNGIFDSSRSALNKLKFYQP
jgi:hypothetical protein